jgi:predicted GNAT superfamily acetyltransferase
MLSEKARTNIQNDPLSPIDSIWVEECNIFTAKLKQSNPTIEFNLIAYKEFIYFDFLRVAEGDRNQGLGTKFFKELVALADLANCPLALTPDASYGDWKETDLERFYERFGFVKNIGKNRDFSTNHTMVRPRKIV